MSFKKWRFLSLLGKQLSFLIFPFLGDPPSCGSTVDSLLCLTCIFIQGTKRVNKGLYLEEEFIGNIAGNKANKNTN